MIEYSVYCLNHYYPHEDPRKYLEATTRDRGFAHWLRSFLADREESHMLEYVVEETEVVE